MWNQINVNAYEGMIAETVSYGGEDGREVRAYLSRPLTLR